MKEELILAVRSDAINKAYPETGFYRMTTVKIMSALESAGLFLGPRYMLEEMPEFRQIIPYVLLEQDGKYVSYTRTAAGSERRLQDKISIGLGGHIDAEDVTFSLESTVELARTVHKTVERELDEELPDVTTHADSWLGLLVVHESDVDKVHIGVVVRRKLVSDIDDCKPEDALSCVGLATLGKLSNVWNNLETWSQLVLSGLCEELMEEYVKE